jgi:hypothetical protein
MKRADIEAKKVKDIAGGMEKFKKTIDAERKAY